MHATKKIISKQFQKIIIKSSKENDNRKEYYKKRTNLKKKERLIGKIYAMYHQVSKGEKNTKV